MSNRYVLDASAVLALLNEEPGGSQVEPLLGDAVISAVNLSEVLAKLIEAGMTPTEAQEAFDLLGVEVAGFDRASALGAAILRPATRNRGLSLGDRACLALGIEIGAEVVTAEREWARLKLACPILSIR